MKKILITILILIVGVSVFSQTDTVNALYANGRFGKKKPINHLVAKTPLAFTTGGGTDTIGCPTCGTGGGITGTGSAQKVAIWNGASSLTFSNSFYDTTKFWQGYNTTSPLGVFHIYPNFPGTVTTTSGSASVSGTNTLFLSNFQPGDSIQYNGETRGVSSIASNTALTLTSNAGSNNTNVAYVNASTNRGVWRQDENGKIYRYNRLFINAVPLLGNTSFGLDALQVMNGTTTQNTAIGYQSMLVNVSGFSNTAVGYLTLKTLAAGGNNVAVGASALTLNTGSDNTAVGMSALSTNSSGGKNTAVGKDALQTNGTAADNTGIGWSALKASTGAANTAVGSSALQVNSTGFENTAVGGGALTSNTTGTQNTAVGRSALGKNRSASSNVAIGMLALDSIITGASNVAIGLSAGSSNNTTTAHDTANSNSIYIGFQTKAKAEAQTNEIVIGYQAIGIGSNTTTLGNTSITDTKINGKINVRASADLTGQTATNASVATYTTGAADSTFEILGRLTATAVTGGTVKLSVTYTDESNTSRTIDFFSMGTTTAALSATGVSSFPVLSIRAKASTAITISTTATSTITYNVGATIIAIR